VGARGRDGSPRLPPRRGPTLPRLGPGAARRGRGHRRRGPGQARGHHRLGDRRLAPIAVRGDLQLSLDGFATTTDQTPENPFGDDWARLTQTYAATRTFRARVMQETSGEGTTG